MNAIKLIFIDLDGPLLDGRERHYHCYQSILEELGFKPLGIDEYWETKRALVNRKDLLKMSDAESIYDDFFVEWLARIESPEMLALDKVQEGAVGYLRSCRAQGIELVLVTMRKDKQALERQLISTGLRQYLDTVLVCEHAEGGEGKADAVRNIYPASQFEECALWVGDTEVDWEAARSLGCRVVLLSNGLRNEAYLRSLQGALVKQSVALLENCVLEGKNAN